MVIYIGMGEGGGPGKVIDIVWSEDNKTWLYKVDWLDGSDGDLEGYTVGELERSNGNE